MQNIGHAVRATFGNTKSPQSLLNKAFRYTEASNLTTHRLLCWITIALAGLAQAWFARHRIVADGISYLEIARNYINGNSHAALSSYWSPLYSWILALAMVVVRPSPYWETSLLYLVNYCAYISSLIGFELFIGALTRFQVGVVGPDRISEQTIRLVGYSVFLVASLALIDIGWNSPDMVATAIGFFLAYFLFQIEASQKNAYVYIMYGALLGFSYLARAAFAPFIFLYSFIAAVLLWRRKGGVFRRVTYILASASLVALPFVVALSVSKQHFTIGEPGKLNYAWEVCGARRYIHWQGEPNDIGKPLHPTHKLLAHPTTYSFGSPVPGTYPPWYDPSYWYAGINPHLKLKPQIAILLGSFKTVAYLFLGSPVVLPVIVLICFMGWRVWLSRCGIFAFWFLWLPALAYILVYMLVYIDSRYIAGSLVVIWMCLLASISVPNPRLASMANAFLQLAALMFGIIFLLARLSHPTLLAADDLVHRREAEWNLNWMIANRFEQMGIKRNTKIAWIGESMDAEWASMLGAQIVAEVPVVWERDTTLMRKVYTDRREIHDFWWASPRQKALVFDAFRNAGAALVIVDEIPVGADSAGWQRVLAVGTPHMPWSGGQPSWQEELGFMWLTAPGSPVKAKQ